MLKNDDEPDDNDDTLDKSGEIIMRRQDPIGVEAKLLCPAQRNSCLLNLGHILVGASLARLPVLRSVGASLCSYSYSYDDDDAATDGGDCAAASFSQQKQASKQAN